MPITLTINGETAEQILSELQTLAGALVKPKIEWRKVDYSEVETAMAADPHGYDPDNIVVSAPLPESIDESQEATAGQTLPPEDNAVVIEDKPKRKRRTKEEMEAERAAGLPPQEGDPDLEPVTSAPVDDIMSDVVAEPQAEAEEKPSVIRREDLQTLVGKIIRNRKLSPAELKQAYIDIGGAPQLAAIDGAHMEALYNFLAEKLQA
jgi:hypothetical protein